MFNFTKKNKNNGASISRSEKWGKSCAVNLYDCNPELIRSEEVISRFAKQLCTEINMRAYGEPIIEHFGDEDRVSGFTLVQLIQTSSITAHFAEETNSVYLDIFSCKDFNSKKVTNFTKEYFQADEVNFFDIIR